MESGDSRTVTDFPVFRPVPATCARNGPGERPQRYQQTAALLMNPKKKTATIQIARSM